MTQQIINIGTSPNDGTGDQFRVAFDKCNDNFTELYTTGAGTTTEGVWNFNQASTDTTTSPTSGRFRTNSGNAATATQFAIHRISINGFDRADTLRTQLVGDIIKLQDKTNADTWARFVVQAMPVDNVDWFQINVAFDSGGGTAPGNNQEILFTFAASSAGAGGGGNVSNVGTPTNGQLAQWTDATHIQGIAVSSLGLASLASPIFTGDPQAPTPTTADNDTSIATTAFVKAQSYATTASLAAFAPLASPALTGNPTAPTAAVGTSTTQVATTAFVDAESVAKAGDTMTGALTLPADPTLVLHAATKQYVDAKTVEPPQGRLTLASATPVMTTTQAAKTTIFYTSYVGNLVPIYDGTNFTMTSIGSEISVATTDITKSPAAIGVSKVNDWFVWNDAGTVRLGHGPDWTSDTARSAGTALVRVNGIWLNNTAITNGPAAQRGTYVGTTRSASTSTLYWQFGSSGAGGSEAFLWVWNCYNRILVTTDVLDSTSSWTYNSTTIRSSNGSAANRINFICGLAEDGLDATMWQVIQPASIATAFGIVGLAMDSTTAFDGRNLIQCLGTSGLVAAATVRKAYLPLLGYHFIQALEQGDGTNSTILFGAGREALLFSYRA
jgi:hypothetical protein